MSERTRMAEHTPEGWALEETQAEVDRLEAELERERHDAWVAMDGTNVKALKAERNAYRDTLRKISYAHGWRVTDIIDLARSVLAGGSSTTEE